MKIKVYITKRVWMNIFHLSSSALIKHNYLVLVLVKVKKVTYAKFKGACNCPSDALVKSKKGQRRRKRDGY